MLPDPSPEQLGAFAPLPPLALNQLMDPKSIRHLTALGGIDGLCLKLHTDGKLGLPDDDDKAAPSSTAGTSRADRQRAYGTNTLPDHETKSLLMLMWLALQDRVLIILCVAAAVSLALGLYQDLGTPPTYIPSPDCPNQQCAQPQVDWVEGVAILAAVVIVVVVGSVNDWQKERQFRLLNAKKEDRMVTGIRGQGRETLINVHDVVVGDVLALEPGTLVSPSDDQVGRVT